MSKKGDNSFFVILGLFIIASIARIAFDSNKYILHIIATINIVSLWYVLYLILEKSDILLKNHLNNDVVISERIKVKKRTLFKNEVKILKILILILGVAYIVICSNGIVNDILGLLTLFFSIEEEVLCKLIAKYFNSVK